MNDTRHDNGRLSGKTCRKKEIMEKRQSDQSIGDVSLSPIYPSNISPAAPTITSSASQGTYYVMSENTNQTTIYATPHNESFTRNANVGLLPASNPGPSRGRWRDSICSWVANLWPSCGCLFIGCGGWHVAQSKYFHLFIGYFVAQFNYL